MGAELADRDRFVDLLRGGSITAVVVGHWLVADLTWQGGRIEQDSALAAVPQMWPLTWVLAVIPLFFFIGGFSNRHSWEGVLRRGQGYSAFLDRRVHRVLVPTGLYLVVVSTVGFVIDQLGGLGIRAIGGLFLQPLWFLGVFLWIAALAPLTVRAHERFRWWTVGALVLLVALGDLGRIVLDVPVMGYANVLTVWLLMHQLGYFYAEGALTRPWLMAVGGWAATAALVSLPAYPATMVGVPGGEAGNMHPPTLAMTTLGFAMIGTALVLRARLTPWLHRPHVWRAVVMVNLFMITLYLWHQPALALAARIALPLGYPHPDAGSIAWWLAHILWLVLPAAVLAVIVALVGRAEQVRPPDPAPPGSMTARAAAVAVCLLGLGLLALAGSSATEPFARGQSLGPVVPSPLIGLAAVAVSAGVLHGVRAGQAGARWALVAGAGVLGAIGVAASAPVLVVAAAATLLAAALPERDRSPVPDR